MDAARLKSLLKSRKRSDREAAMAQVICVLVCHRILMINEPLIFVYTICVHLQLSFDGTPLQDMIYSDFEEILEYMNIKVQLVI